MNVTIMRPFNGIGDWLFALACVKYVNRQRPDVRVHVAFDRVRPSKLPAVVPELFRLSDARYEDGYGPADSVATHDSLVYRQRPPELFLESTVAHLNAQLGLGVKYEHGVYPSFGTARWNQPNGRPVVVIHAHGKKRIRGGKEWGFENFSSLASRLIDDGFEVVQLGAADDWLLPRASGFVMGAPAAEVVALLLKCSLFVGIENGLMVLAGFMGVPQLTVYDGGGYPTRVDFPRQHKIAERVEVDQVLARLQELRCSSTSVSAAA